MNGQAKAKEAAEVFRQWVGSTQDSHGRIFLWDKVKPACNGDAYCATGVVAAYMAVGVDLRLLMEGAFEPYDVPNWLTLASRKKWLTHGPSTGDIALIAPLGPVSHMGIADPNAEQPFLTIEANTTPHWAGARGIWTMDRKYGEIVAWIDMGQVVDHMYRLGLYDPAGPLPEPDMTGYETLVGHQAEQPWDHETLRHYQRLANITVDGKWGSETHRAVTQILEESA